MIEESQLQNIGGRDVYGSDGDKIGSAGQIYADDQTGQPDWLSVNTGLFGMSESFVPLRDASFDGERIEVPYDKSTVKDAPNVAADGHLSPEEEQQLYKHYSMDWSATQGYGQDMAQRAVAPRVSPEMRR